jgi:hypothetical protein
VFVACGLWHGANWTFVIWGVHHGAFLIIERAGLGLALARHSWLARAYLLLAVMTGWVWFRAARPRSRACLLRRPRGSQRDVGAQHRDALVVHPVTIGALLIGAVLARSSVDVQRVLRVALRARAAHVRARRYGRRSRCSSLSILSVAAGAYSPFLYFRF